MDTKTALRVALEEWLPGDTGVAEPTWMLLVLPDNSSAPMVWISRDARSGPRLTPVYFVGPGDPRRLLPVGQRMFEETRVGRLVHMAGESPDSGFLVIPALYHLDDIYEFSAAVERYLTSLDLGSIVWRCEQCEVRIAHLGRSYQARRDPDGTIAVAAVAET